MKKILFSIIVGSLIFPLVTLGQFENATLNNSNLWVTLTNIANFIFALLLTAAVIAILISAFNFVTAAGDTEKIGKARTFLIYALVAIVVAVLARGIVSYIKTTLPG